MEEIGDYSQRFASFHLHYIIVQLIGLTIVILVGSWIGIFLGGLGWSSDVSLQFNWHPLLMTIGMIFLYANSILVYRGFRHGRKKNLKWMHALIHCAVFLLVIIALVAVFDSHNYANPPIPNMYSLHSWIGLTSVILFACQWLAGFISFLIPGLKEPIREIYMPVHIFFGLLGFICAAASALLGLSEKAFFHIKNITDLPHEGMIVNTIGFLIVIFTVYVVYLVTDKNFKRSPQPEDTILLTGNAE